MTMPVRRTAGCLAIVLVTGLAAACTSSGGPDTAGPGASSTGPAPTGSGSSSPVVVPSSGSSSPGATSPTTAGSGTPADASTAQSIRSAYTDFFNSTSTTAMSQAALQHGASFKKTLEDQAKDSLSKNSGVKVAAVRTKGNLGFVTFTVTSDGAPLLTNFKGYAVREGGRWKVAAITFCTLLQLQGGAPAACNNPSITALPK